MISKYKLAFLGLILSVNAMAQSFTNGSLEAVGVVPCQYIATFQFSTYLPNTGYAFSTIDIGGGIKGRHYFYDASCNDGSAQNGNNFLGLAANDAGLADGISLLLTAPLVANKTYVLKFYMKKPKSQTTMALDIGYTTDSLAFGTLVTTVQAPASTSWAVKTVNIKPTVATKFITIRGVKANSGTFNFSYVHIDNFTLAQGTDVTAPTKKFNLEPSPNPFATSLNFVLADDFAMPCHVSLCDLTGRTTFQQEVHTRNVRIDRNNLSAGVYFLHLRDANGVETNRRIVAE